MEGKSMYYLKSNRRLHHRFSQWSRESNEGVFGWLMVGIIAILIVVGIQWIGAKRADNLIMTYGESPIPAPGEVIGFK